MKHETFFELADRLDVHSAMVQAYAAVESNGRGFLKDDPTWPANLCEAHWFGKLTGYVYNDSHPDLSCTTWEEARQHYVGGIGEKRRFERMRALNESAAIQSCSWGAFQIMGFHWKDLKYNSPREFWEAMFTEDGQLEAFCRFLEKNPAILKAMRVGDYATMARLYNGTGQVPVYSAKLKAAYEKFANDAMPDFDGRDGTPWVAQQKAEEFVPPPILPDLGRRDAPIPEVDRNMPAPSPANSGTVATGVVVAAGAGVSVVEKAADIAKKIEAVSGVTEKGEKLATSVGRLSDALLSGQTLLFVVGVLVMAAAIYGIVRYVKKVRRGEVIVRPLFQPKDEPPFPKIGG